MATYSCHWLIMGKMKTGIYCYLTVDILTKLLQKCFLNGPLPNIPFFCCNFLIWLVTMATNRGNLHQKKSKNISSEGVWGMKLCRNVSNISLKKNCFLFPLLKHVGCYGNLKFPLTYNGKNENWGLLYCYLIADILTKVLQKCLLSGPLPSISYYFSLNLSICLAVMATKRLNLPKKKY